MKICVTENGKSVIRDMTAEELVEYKKVTDTRSYKERLIELIRQRYDLDDELAIHSNYELYQSGQSDNLNYLLEWEEYQRYRQACKNKLKENNDE